MIHGNSGTSTEIIRVPELPWIMGISGRQRAGRRQRGPGGHRRGGGSVGAVRYTGSYAVVLALHLLTVVFVVGPLAVTAVTASRLVRAGDVVALRAAARTTRLFSIATVATVVLGSAMLGLGSTGDQWQGSQGWVSASYALWLVALGLTVVLVLRGLRAAAAAAEQGEPTAGFAGRVAIGGGLAMLCWLTIVVLMVTKPGA